MKNIELNYYMKAYNKFPLMEKQVTAHVTIGNKDLDNLWEKEPIQNIVEELKK